VSVCGCNLLTMSAAAAVLQHTVYNIELNILPHTI